MQYLFMQSVLELNGAGAHPHRKVNVDRAGFFPVSQLQLPPLQRMLPFKALAPFVTTDAFVGQRLPCTSLIRLHSLGG